MKGIVSMLSLWEAINPINFIMDVVNLIPKLVYFITATAMSILDIAQMLIRKLAGLDVHYSADGTAQTGDITLSFLQGIFGNDPNYTSLRNAFWSLIILSVILLVVSTIIAIIRQEYMPGQEESRERPSNTKTHVINRAIKSLFMFLIVPVSVFFGLMLSDAVLRAMDTITSGTGSSAIVNAKGVTGKDGEGNDILTYPTDRLVAETVGDGKTTSYVYYDFFSLGVPTTGMPFSGFAFKSAGFSANRVRVDKTYSLNNESKSFYELVKMGNVSNFSIFNYAESKEEMASMIDDAFAGNIQLRDTGELSFDSAANKDIKNSLVFQTGNINRFSKFNVPLVWYYYDLWQYNFVIAFAFLIVSLKLMIKIVVGLMKRIIEIVVLFLVSPPVIALMPLDGGKAFGQWKNSFLSKALGVYGAVIGMNILFLLLPYINQIKFLEEGVAFTVGQNLEVYNYAAKMVNMIISTLFIITGLIVVDGLIALMSSIIGADDIAKEGGEITEKVGDTLQKSLNATAMVAGGAAKAVTAPFRLARDGANAVGRKVTGNQDFKIGKAMAKGAGALGKGMLKRIPLGITSKQAAKTTMAHNEDWEKKGGLGDQAYDSYLEGQGSYKEDMQNAYENRRHKALTYDEWLENKEGIEARDKALTSAALGDVQSKGAFIRGEKGPGADARHASLKSAIMQEASAYANLQRAGGYLKQKGAKLKDSKFARGASAAGRGVYSALKPAALEAFEFGKHMSSYASNLYGSVEEAMGRKGKPKFLDSMVKSFKGQSEKAQSDAKKVQDFYKEQKRKEDYEKGKKGGGTGGTGGISSEAVKEIVKKENIKLQTQLEEDFKKQMEEKVEYEQKELREQVIKQEEEISRLKKRK